MQTGWLYPTRQIRMQYMFQSFEHEQRIFDLYFPRKTEDHYIYRIFNAQLRIIHLFSQQTAFRRGGN